MKIGILQTGRAPQNLRAEHGDYDLMCADLIREDSDEIISYAVLDGALPNDVNECDVWFVTGSRHGVYEQHDWIAPLEGFLRQAFKAERKIVGVCFGHQILAQALGGKVHKHPGGYGIGVMDYVFDDGGDGKESVSLCAWHQDQILEIPKMATVIGTSDFCRYAALSYGDTAISFQAHPEFDSDYMHDLIQGRRNNGISESQAVRGLASLKTKVDSFKIAEQIKRFLMETGVTKA